MTDSSAQAATLKIFQKTDILEKTNKEQIPRTLWYFRDTKTLHFQCPKKRSTSSLRSAFENKQSQNKNSPHANILRHAASHLTRLMPHFKVVYGETKQLHVCILNKQTET